MYIGRIAPNLKYWEEPCGILKKFVYACMVNVIHAKVLPGSVLYIAKFEKFEKVGAARWVCNTNRS